MFPSRFVLALLGQCIEERTFYRMISGLHTSITVGVLSNYLHTGARRFLAACACSAEAESPTVADVDRGRARRPVEARCAFVLGLSYKYRKDESMRSRAVSVYLPRVHTTSPPTAH